MVFLLMNNASNSNIYTLFEACIWQLYHTPTYTILAPPLDRCTFRSRKKGILYIQQFLPPPQDTLATAQLSLQRCTLILRTILYIPAGVSFSPPPTPGYSRHSATLTKTHTFLRTNIHYDRGKFSPFPLPSVLQSIASRGINCIPLHSLQLP